MSSANYPDILGLITDGARCNVNVVQLALATRPRVIRAGRPFEALMLVQNAADVDVDVTVTIHLPEVDANKQKNPFMAHANRLVVGVCPAEVGYIRLPILSAPFTAVHEGYKLGAAVQVKPLNKPHRIRSSRGGGPVEQLSETTSQAIADLQKLHYSTGRHFVRQDTLEVDFSVLSGKLGRLSDLNAGWVSLWTMTDYLDHTSLFELYAPLLAESVLPRLKAQYLLEPLRDVTLQHFEAAGYPLAPVEALFIAKMLMRVLQRADPIDDLGDYRTEDVYNVLHTIEVWKQDRLVKPLPHWCIGLLHLIAHNRSVVDHTQQAISQSLYFDLIRDAVPLALQHIETETGQALDDADNYTDELLLRLQGEDPLQFEFAYLPLLLGGLTVHHRVYTGQRLDDEMNRLQVRLEERLSEQTDQNKPVFDLALDITERMSQQFHFTM